MKIRKRLFIASEDLREPEIPAEFPGGSLT
jgi:hypothetical protein